MLSLITLLAAVTGCVDATDAPIEQRPLHVADGGPGGGQDVELVGDVGQAETTQLGAVEIGRESEGAGVDGADPDPRRRHAEPAAGVLGGVPEDNAVSDADREVVSRFLGEDQATSAAATGTRGVPHGAVDIGDVDDDVDGSVVVCAELPGEAKDGLEFTDGRLGSHSSNRRRGGCVEAP